VGEQLGRLGQLEVDDLPNALDVEPSGGHVGREQDRQLARAKRRDHPLARILAQVPLERPNRVALLLELAG
jgi:hypothetical protein